MQLANGLLQTTSTNAQTSSDTSFTPSTVTGFPTSPQFTLLNVRTGELVLVTALGGTWTITRGYGGSAAAAFNAGDALQYSLTREMLLGGFVAKLDEQIIVSATSGTATLTVPPASMARHLQVLWKIRCDNASTQQFSVRFNGDAGNNYDWGLLESSGTAQANGAGQSAMRFGQVPGTGTTANRFAAGRFHVIDAFSTTQEKACTGEGWRADGAFIEYNGGTWHSLAAISTVGLLTTGGNIIAGSVFSLYGMP